jgi:hypothetical protein
MVSHALQHLRVKERVRMRRVGVFFRCQQGIDHLIKQPEALHASSEGVMLSG